MFELAHHARPHAWKRAQATPVAAKTGIALDGITVGYGRKAVLADFSLEVRPGSMVFLIGPSGAGKSTLLRTLFGTLRLRSGQGWVDGTPLHALRFGQRRALRRRLGFVFQSYELLPHLSALENVLLPLQLAHPRLRDPVGYAKDALELVGLGDKMNSRPQELSGGQQQRVVIARAVAHEPRILLADEPTGNLDRQTSKEVMDVFQQLNQLGSTLVVATHDESLLDEYDAQVVSLW